MNVDNLTISAKEVYNGQKLEAPHGFTFTGEFRTPRIGEMYLPTSLIDGASVCSIPDSGRPRLILKPKTLSFKFRRVSNFILAGEFFEDADGSIRVALDAQNLQCKRDIYEKE